MKYTNTQAATNLFQAEYFFQGNFVNTQDVGVDANVIVALPEMKRQQELI